jgi:hypothetical protein
MDDLQETAVAILIYDFIEAVALVGGGQTLEPGAGRALPGFLCAHA